MTEPCVIVMREGDNVAVALHTLEPGEELISGVMCAEAIPAAHKVAVRPIGQGEAVVKYGAPIGRATAPIFTGQHVHTHNVESERMRGDRG
jgi:altronate hydrolase